MRCTARSKRSGEQCKRHATPGRNVCAMHGGKTPVGVALPQFDSGRYSKYLPEQLRERAEQARTDPDLLAFRDELALNDARLLELIKRLSTGEGPDVWQLLALQFGSAQELLAAGELDELGQVLDAMARTLARGASDRAQWAEINEALDMRRRLADSERRRLVDLQQHITVERAMVMIAKILTTLRKHVREPATLAAIAAELGELTLVDPH